MSRTKNTIRNLMFGYAEELIIVLLSFFNRRVFVQVLGTQFTGLSSVINSILGTLNLVELGFGAAIIYNLYIPLANKDDKKIKALMNYYQRTYIIIGFIIAGIGMILMPFLPMLIKDDLSFTNIYLVFGIQLLQTASTYFFFAYKQSLLNADQKSYIISKTRCIFIIVQYVSQILILYITKSYIIYLIVVLLFNIAFNLTIAIRANKEYPILKSKEHYKLSQDEKKQIKGNCTALFIYKVNSAVISATDSLILSKFVGLSIVGFYGHYLTIVTAIKTILNKIFYAMTGSLGNLHAESLLGKEKELEHEEEVFRCINMLSFAAFGIGGIGLYSVADSFIEIWIGEGQTLPNSAVLLITLELFLYSLTKPTSSFRASMGLFQQAKYRPIASMILNIIISLALVSKYNVTGVLFGTIASIALTTFWFDPVIIYKYGFKRNAKPYFFRTLVFAIIEGLSIASITLLKRIIVLCGFMGIIFYGVIGCGIFIALYILLLRKFSEYKVVKTIITSYFKKIFRKKRIV